mgnify:CR=1 FL=1
MDEKKQMRRINKGNMSNEGQRKELFKKDDLKEMRKEKGVEKEIPGRTGWEKVNGRDELKNKIFELNYKNHLQNLHHMYRQKLLQAEYQINIRDAKWAHLIKRNQQCGCAKKNNCGCSKSNLFEHMENSRNSNTKERFLSVALLFGLCVAVNIK